MKVSGRKNLIDRSTFSLFTIYEETCNCTPSKNRISLTTCPSCRPWALYQSCLKTLMPTARNYDSEVYSNIILSVEDDDLAISSLCVTKAVEERIRPKVEIVRNKKLEKVCFEI